MSTHLPADIMTSRMRRRRRAVSIIDYTESDPRSGDVIVALDEVDILRQNGYEVVVLGDSREFEIGQDPREVAASLFHSRSYQRVDFVICNHSSRHDLATFLSRMTNAPYVFREHIDYDAFVSTIAELNLDATRIITRASVDETLENYHKAKMSSDVVITTSTLSISARQINGTIFCPPPLAARQPSNMPLWIRKQGALRIVIGGRLCDPLKGATRILKVLERVEKQIQDYEVHAIGLLSDSTVERLAGFLGERFTNHGWIDSRSRYIEVLSKGHIFLTLPFYESFGVTLAEAVMLGLIPVSTAQGVARLLPALKYASGEDLATVVNGSMAEQDIINAVSEIIVRLASTVGLNGEAASPMQQCLSELYADRTLLSNVLATL